MENIILLIFNYLLTEILIIILFIHFFLLSKLTTNMHTISKQLLKKIVVGIQKYLNSEKVSSNNDPARSHNPSFSPPLAQKP